MIKAFNISNNLLQILDSNIGYSFENIENIFFKLPINFWFDFKIKFTTVDGYKIDNNYFELTICSNGIKTIKVNSKQLTELFLGIKNLIDLDNE